jgi:hypothetical protein
MLLSLVCVAGAVQMGITQFLGNHDPHRPVATLAPYPVGMADDVRRPGFNGRLWVGRPIMGSMQQGPYPVGWGSPGPEAYGAFDNQDADVWARVGHQVVGISPWESIDLEGLKRLEAARGFWLQEQGYTGGVRTFVNDRYMWKQDEEKADAHASAVPTPRATITLPADLPRQRRRIRVDAAPSPAVCPGVGPARISWPMTAPADAVARTEARGGLLAGDEPARVISAAK